MDARTRVGEFFALGEFADKRGGGLPPVAAQVHIARLCCVVLDPMRRRFGVTRINSGWRTDASNTAVGGASQSRHMYHRFPTSPAADFTCAKGTPREWYAYADELLGGKGGLGLYSGHVHVDRRDGRSRWTG